ncbi:MAG: hypothetical protein HQL90_09710 [Magnetococcales bacterium]|nr:hypothetical protein [Magnetococcales bacterium]
MRLERKSLNPKRRMRPPPQDDGERQRLNRLAERSGYGGNPEHKRNPGNFGLTPPNSLRPDKALCDDAGIFTRSEEAELLQAGIRRGLVSVQEKGEWPQNVWAVNAQGVPLEAQLENAGLGTYHGYPMPERDPFRQEVLDRWQES